MAELTSTLGVSEPTEDQKLWIGRLRLAQRYQDEQGNQTATSDTGAGSVTSGRWDRYRKAYAGDFNSVAELGEEAIDVNFIHSNMATTLPPLWLQ